MFFDIPRCYRNTPLRTYPGLTANIHWRFAPRKERTGRDDADGGFPSCPAGGVAALDGGGA